MESKDLIPGTIEACCKLYDETDDPELRVKLLEKLERWENSPEAMFNVWIQVHSATKPGSELHQYAIDYFDQNEYIGMNFRRQEAICGIRVPGSDAWKESMDRLEAQAEDFVDCHRVYQLSCVVPEDSDRRKRTLLKMEQVSTDPFARWEDLLLNYGYDESSELGQYALNAISRMENVMPFTWFRVLFNENPRVKGGFKGLAYRKLLAFMDERIA